MNCKPGDLARIVCPHPSVQDKIVRLTDLHSFGARGPAWSYEGPRLVDPQISKPLDALYDCWLRPIRDPGDDAQDESFQWAPAPEKVSA